MTLAAASAQVFRNGAQAGLTKTIGMLGATQVRFVFGLPFALLFLAGGLAITDQPLPGLTTPALGWAALGAVCQILGTALMLLVMHQRAFGVAYAYIKTEPVLVAVLGVILLGDHLSPLAWAAVGVVTAGVLVASVKPGEYRNLLKERRMIAAGVGAGGLFGLSAIAFRGGIGALEGGDFLIRALTVLAISLTIQAGLLGLWLVARDRAAFTGSLKVWRTSLGAGFLGAFASACWFTAFALTPAANVRTLGLIEMPLAALLAGRLTGKAASRHEVIGLTVVMAGVGLLFASLA
ncbi:DMT family transporter [Novosphingobium sp.]|uniref:DMT family transporter n=1 Tax=Novosphingobium sp. TaxID=1874826 RepID=UPI0022BD9670|nr:DMT family transporter [Novosphingobium sp.]MCZ8019680.1 DMT family transporter [Novosphingobium sp.]MCZ8035495.1 DMT family transporter [Novosphingobium sp.]MCZ8050809.1 DMT family transporter [Novosphingobium sp.]MCZ8059155.1 DMT family transporter [Novosphingobium sp.]MCZ8232601.1 DMT family transporter [Novosphingobium sp.]